MRGENTVNRLLRDAMAAIKIAPSDEHFMDVYEAVEKYLKTVGEDVSLDVLKLCLSDCAARAHAKLHIGNLLENLK